MSGRLSVPENAGIVATLVRGNEVVAIHKPGTPTFALHAVVRACDRYGWKIQSLSSPSTIYRDLLGPRTYTPGQRGDMYNDHGEPPEAKPQMPERLMLSIIGRTDVLSA